MTNAGKRLKPFFAAKPIEYRPALRKGRAWIVCAMQHERRTLDASGVFDRIVPEAGGAVLMTAPEYQELSRRK